MVTIAAMAAASAAVEFAGPAALIGDLSGVAAVCILFVFGVNISKGRGADKKIITPEIDCNNNLKFKTAVVCTNNDENC